MIASRVRFSVNFALLICALILWPVVSLAQPQFKSIVTEIQGDGEEDGTMNLAVPSPVSVGDVMIAIVVKDNPPAFTSAPDGWAELDTTVIGNAFGGVWYKTVTQSDVDNQGMQDFYGWTWADAEEATGTILVYSDVDPANPIADFGMNTGESDRPTAPSESASRDNSRILRAFGANNDRTVTSFPSSHMSRYAYLSSAQDGVSQGGADRVQASSGSTGTGQFLISGSTDWMAVTVVINPPGGLGGIDINAGLNGNWWFGPGRSGEGAQLEVGLDGAGNVILVATFYSYDDMGNQIFLIAVGQVTGDTAHVDVFITDGAMWGDDFDPADVTETPWGSGTFTALSCGLIHMSLTPNAQYLALGYTNLEYDLIRLITPILQCPIANPG